jgi:hypothetical protein
MELIVGQPSSLASELVAETPATSMHRDNKDIPAAPLTLRDVQESIYACSASLAQVEYSGITICIEA